MFKIKIKINNGYSYFFGLKSSWCHLNVLKIPRLTNLNIVLFKMNAVKVVDKKWKVLSAKITQNLQNSLRK